MLSIDEVIARERQQAKKQRSRIGTWGDEHSNKKCEVYAEYHEQLAEWLEELKLLKEEKKEFQIIARDNYEIGYEKAIDEFVKMCDEAKVCETYYCVSMGEIRYIAEQLKEGVSNEII